MRSGGLVVIGSGDHARVAIECARAAGRDVVTVVEPDPNRITPTNLPSVRLSRDFAAVARQGAEFLVAIGDNRARAALFMQALDIGGTPGSIVHPTAVVLAGAVIGDGSIICAGAIVGLDARIGRNVIVNTRASLDHDVHVDNHASVAPGSTLAGRVVIGEGAYVGIGAVVIEGLRIGAWSLVAGGAAVVRDVPARTRVAGVPARAMAEGSLEDPK